MTGKEVLRGVERLIEDTDFALDTHRELYRALCHSYDTNDIISREDMTNNLDIESIEELTKIFAIDTDSIISGKNTREVLYGCLVAMRMSRMENELKGLDKNKLEKEGDLIKIKELYNELNRYRNLRGRMDALKESDLLPPGQKKGGESN
jgi:hypothetical protein